MRSSPSAVAIIAAFALAAVGYASALAIVDPTPLLVAPTPDLDWLLGLIGIATGLWSASQIMRFPHTPKGRLGRISIWVMLPIFLGFGLPAMAKRTQEAISFRNGTTTAHATGRVVEKRRSSSRSGNPWFYATVAVPTYGNPVDVSVDPASFAAIEPTRSCVLLAIEHASNGAVRLRRVLRWNVPCPSVAQDIRS